MFGDTVPIIKNNFGWLDRKCGSKHLENPRMTAPGLDLHKPECEAAYSMIFGVS